MTTPAHMARAGANKMAQRTLQVLEFVKNNQGCTSRFVFEQAGEAFKDFEAAREVLFNLAGRTYTINTSSKGLPAKWQITKAGEAVFAAKKEAIKKPKSGLSAPDNGPGHTRPTVVAFDTPKHDAWSNFRYDPTTYDWPHLRLPDRVDADTHKMCGSLSNGFARPYSGPKPMCVGAAGPVAAGGAVQRGRYAS